MCVALFWLRWMVQLENSTGIYLYIFVYDHTDEMYQQTISSHFSPRFLLHCAPRPKLKARPGLRTKENAFNSSWCWLLNSQPLPLKVISWPRYTIPMSICQMALSVWTPWKKIGQLRRHLVMYWALSGACWLFHSLNPVWTTKQESCLWNHMKSIRREPNWWRIFTHAQWTKRRLNQLAKKTTEASRPTRQHQLPEIGR